MPPARAVPELAHRLDRRGQQDRIDEPGRGSRVPDGDQDRDAHEGQQALRGGGPEEKRLIACHLALEYLEAALLGPMNPGSTSVPGLRGRGPNRVLGDRRGPPGQEQHLVGQVHRLLEIVRDQQHRRAGLHEDLLQLLADEEGHLEVERRERLVEEQHLGRTLSARMIDAVCCWPPDSS